jgi:hypothetical protein
MEVKKIIEIYDADGDLVTLTMEEAKELYIKLAEMFEERAVASNNGN